MADFEPFWSLWSEQRISRVAWRLLPPRLATFLGLGFVLVLSLTLRIAGIEGSTGSAINVDDEVKWTGLASFAAGACGTVIGSHSPGLTTFNVEAGTTTAQAAVLTGVLQLLLWLSGFPVMNMFPRFYLSGILMNLGLVMLQEWMWTARHKVGILGLLVIYAQVASSMMYGLLPSVLVGVAVALLTAQAQLMRLHVLKYHVSRLSVRTNLQRSQRERALLNQHGNFIECLGLEGFLAEGPIIKLSNYVRHYVENNKMLRFIIFDLQACQGCNVSAYALLAKLDKVLQNEGIEALYSSLDCEMSSGLKSFGVPAQRIFDTLSSSNSSFLQALERCEDMVMESLLEGFQRQISPLLEVSETPEQMMQIELQDFLGLSQEQAVRLVKAGRFCCKDVNSRLARQGMVEQNMYIAVPNYSKVVETVDVGSNCGAEQEVSLSRFGFVCCMESVLYDEPARATCRVLIPSQLLMLSKAAARQLVDSDPALGNRLSRVVAQQCLRQSDALRQALQLSEGGGWKGGHFDLHTASVCMKMIDNEKGTACGSESQQVAQHFSTLRSPTVIRRKRPLSPKGKVYRASTIENWSMNWMENRENRQSV